MSRPRQSRGPFAFIILQWVVAETVEAEWTVLGD